MSDLKNTIKTTLNESDTIDLSLSDSDILTGLLDKKLNIWHHFSKDTQSLIQQRLGWLDSSIDFDVFKKISDYVNTHQIKYFYWIGMGGSGLFAKCLQSAFSNLSLKVIDNLDFKQLYSLNEKDEHHIKHSLFFFASKSGQTKEVQYLQNFILKKLKSKHTVLLSDYSDFTQLQTPLNSTQHSITIKTPHDVGGRYSPSTYMGMVPYYLCQFHSLNALSLIKEEFKNLESFKSSLKTFDKHPQVGLIKLVNKLFNEIKCQKYKLNLKGNDDFKFLDSWIEQLIAESLGKTNNGILPVPKYSFQTSTMQNNISIDCADQTWGIPNYSNNNILCYCYYWMLLTSILAIKLKINPFDEPHVALSKKQTQTFLKTNSTNKIFFTPISNIAANIQKIDDKDFLALLYFGPLDQVRQRIFSDTIKNLSEHFNKDVFLYHGPKYLHSLGQFFKGGQNNTSAYCIILDEMKELNQHFDDIVKLNKAQAMGDFKAMQALDKNVHFVSYNDFIQFEKKLKNI